jgi:hypothetical protein
LCCGRELAGIHSACKDPIIAIAFFPRVLPEGCQHFIQTEI